MLEVNYDTRNSIDKPLDSFCFCLARNAKIAHIKAKSFRFADESKQNGRNLFFTTPLGLTIAFSRGENPPKGTREEMTGKTSYPTSFTRKKTTFEKSCQYSVYSKAKSELY